MAAAVVAAGWCWTSRCWIRSRRPRRGSRRTGRLKRVCASRQCSRTGVPSVPPTRGRRRPRARADRPGSAPSRPRRGGRRRRRCRCGTARRGAAGAGGRSRRAGRRAAARGRARPRRRSAPTRDRARSARRTDRRRSSSRSSASAGSAPIRSTRLGGQADLLARLAQRGLAQVVLVDVLAPAGERDLAGVAAQVVAPLRQDDVQPAVRASRTAGRGRRRRCGRARPAPPPPRGRGGRERQSAWARELSSRARRARHARRT